MQEELERGVAQTNIIVDKPLTLSSAPPPSIRQREDSVLPKEEALATLLMRMLICEARCESSLEGAVYNRHYTV